MSDEPSSLYRCVFTTRTLSSLAPTLFYLFTGVCVSPVDPVGAARGAEGAARAASRQVKQTHDITNCEGVTQTVYPSWCVSPQRPTMHRSVRLRRREGRRAHLLPGRPHRPPGARGRGVGAGPDTRAGWNISSELHRGGGAPPSADDVIGGDRRRCDGKFW